eukprot:s531_g14.t2
MHLDGDALLQQKRAHQRSHRHGWTGCKSYVVSQGPCHSAHQTVRSTSLPARPLLQCSWRKAYPPYCPTTQCIEEPTVSPLAEPSSGIGHEIVAQA